MCNSKKFSTALKKLGQHIKELREERDISIKELSEKSGIRKEYLQKIESGNAYRVMVNTHLVKIAKAMKIKLSELLDYE